LENFTSKENLQIFEFENDENYNQQLEFLNVVDYLLCNSIIDIFSAKIAAIYKSNEITIFLKFNNEILQIELSILDLERKYNQRITREV